MRAPAPSSKPPSSPIRNNGSATRVSVPGQVSPASSSSFALTPRSNAYVGLVFARAGDAICFEPTSGHSRRPSFGCSASSSKLATGFSSATYLRSIRWNVSPSFASAARSFSPGKRRSFSAVTSGPSFAPLSSVSMNVITPSLSCVAAAPRSCSQCSRIVASASSASMSSARSSFLPCDFSNEVKVSTRALRVRVVVAGTAAWILPRRL
jgi:hypothetical protein